MNLDPWLMLVAAVIAVIVLKRLVLGGMRVAPNIVREKISAGARIVDVRSPDEFRGGAYPGAVNIPLDELSRRFGEIPRDKPVILYCASGARSAMAARSMKQAGFADVVNAGGLSNMPR